MNVVLTEKSSPPAHFVAGFDEAAFNRLETRDEPALLRALREQAFQAYRALPVPQATDEEWRRTDPALFPFAQFHLMPRLSPVSGMENGNWDQHFDVVVSVGDSGFEIRDVSGVLREGRVSVSSLAQAAEKTPDLINKYFRAESLSAPPGKFQALNQAFWNVGLFIHIPDKVELERGVLLRYQHRADHSVLIPRLLVAAGRHSRATVVEHLVSADSAPFLAITGKEMVVEEGAHLQVVSLQEWGTGTYVITDDWARVERDGQVAWLTLNFGSKVSKMKFGSDVAGPGSSAELDGIYFAAGEQHLDQKTLQVHSSRDTYSRLLYKGAVKDKSHSVYQGLIQAKPGAVKVDAYQTNNNLVLSDGARADTIPGLLIDADDLKCSHGATIGNLDQNQIFYLRSRGLSEAEARRIAIFGFFEEVVKRIPHEFLRERVQHNIEAKLSSSV